MNTNKKTPKLRFKGFTDDWEQRKLGSIGSTYTGLSGKTKEDFGHGEAQYITYLNVFQNTVSDVAMTDKVEIDTTQNEVKYGDVLFTTSSETPEEVGMSSVWLGHTPNIYLNSFCFGFRPNQKINPYFLGYSLRAPYMRDKIKILAQGISRYNISKNKVMELEISLPNNEEQSLLGNFLRNIDLGITLHQRKLEKLKLAKKALLQKLFPKNGSQFPEIRFKDFTDAWEQRKLSDISTKVTTKNVDVHYTETLTNSAEQGIISQVDFFDKEISNKDNINGYYIVENNDFIYNPRISTLAPVGPINRNKLNRTGIMSPLYTVFRASKVDLGFLEWYFQSNHWHRYMKLNGDSGARADRIAIKDSTFFEMPIKTPVNIKEQVFIGETLEKFNQYITLHQRKLDHLISIKKGLLQQLFV
ncbi:restriction endonuclease subunit S [Veillonella tobetsuensis]|uniref:restriction endonuclease subunit S n=1 Tax=Veillonella tobetsuensis TaxID=1110546 RepID=UPI00075161C3|nr:restriction endonuclease subunit S [Veillonella tobetsuensis]